MANHIELINLSNVTQNGGSLPSGWIPLPNDESGFKEFGPITTQAYQNPITGEVVLSIKGTDEFFNFNDGDGTPLSADWTVVNASFESGNYPQDIKDLVKYAHELNIEYNIDDFGNTLDRISITGFSQGGGLGELLSYTFGWSGNAQYAPGAGKLIQNEAYTNQLNELGITPKGVPNNFITITEQGDVVDGFGNRLSNMAEFNITDDTSVVSHLLSSIPHPLVRLGALISIAKDKLNQHDIQKLADYVNNLNGDEKETFLQSLQEKSLVMINDKLISNLDSYEKTNLDTNSVEYTHKDGSIITIRQNGDRTTSTFFSSPNENAVVQLDGEISNPDKITFTDPVTGEYQEWAPDERGEYTETTPVYETQTVVEPYTGENPNIDTTTTIEPENDTVTNQEFNEADQQFDDLDNEYDQYPDGGLGIEDEYKEDIDTKEMVKEMDYDGDGRVGVAESKLSAGIVDGVAGLISSNNNFSKIEQLSFDLATDLIVTEIRTRCIFNSNQIYKKNTLTFFLYQNKVTKKNTLQGTKFPKGSLKNLNTQKRLRNSLRLNSPRLLSFEYLNFLALCNARDGYGSAEALFFDMGLKEVA